MHILRKPNGEICLITDEQVKELERIIEKSKKLLKEMEQLQKERKQGPWGNCKKASQLCLRVKRYINKKIENFSVEDVFLPWELEFFSEQIERYSKKYFPTFSEKASIKINSWCSCKVDEDGWHPNLFEGIVLILTMTYFAARTAVLVFVLNPVLLLCLFICLICLLT